MRLYSLISIFQLVYFSQQFVYEAKSLSGDFYYERKILKTSLFEILCVFNRITATELLKILPNCFEES